MRTLILCLFCGAIAAQTNPAKPEPLAALEGRVLNQVTGEPLAEVKLKLKAPGQSAFGQPAFVTVSDETGNFAFAGLTPGSYTLSAERAGFANANFGARGSRTAGAPVTLIAGGALTGLEFKLKPQGVIAGRVLGADDGAGGGPIMVNAMRVSYLNGAKRLTSAASVYGLDVADEFRLSGLPPGRYYVVATGTPRVGRDQPRDLSGKPASTFLTTFHPSATDVEHAEPVDLAAGAAVTGVDIHMVSARPYPARGRMVNRTGGPLTDTMFTLYSSDTGASGYSSMNTAIPPSGLFEASELPQGRARIMVSGMAPSGRRLYTVTTLSVTGPIEDLELPIRPGVQLKGRLAVEGAPQPKGLTVTLNTLEQTALGIFPPIPVGEDGAFSGADVNLDRYRVTVNGLPQGFYVKSIRLGAAEALENTLDLTRAPEQPLEIVVSAKAASIAGVVKAAGGAPDSGVTVVLVPRSAKRRNRAEWYRSAVTDQNGKFLLAGLAPGEYTLLAWEDVEDGAWFDPDFLKPIEAKGTPITVGEGAAETVELKAMGVQ
jgi:hypothetical protein